MGVTVEPSEPADLVRGSHVCWVVGEPPTYIRRAASVLMQAAQTHEKPIVFGPEGSHLLEALRPLAAISVDPRIAFLDGGPLDPDVMFAMFDEQSACARDEGYRGLRLVADMDWLLAGRPTTEVVVDFELLLDRHAKRLGATIVCAYREASFDTEVLAGALCVHPIDMGYKPQPQFRLVAGPSDTWRLIGDIDIAVVANFKTAVSTAVQAGPCILDASALKFIDVAGIRALAEASRSHDVTIQVVGAPPIVRRGWEMAGFADVAPAVHFVS